MQYNGPTFSVQEHVVSDVFKKLNLKRLTRSRLDAIGKAGQQPLAAQEESSVS